MVTSSSLDARVRQHRHVGLPFALVRGRNAQPPDRDAAKYQKKADQGPPAVRQEKKGKRRCEREAGRQA